LLSLLPANADLGNMWGIFGSQEGKPVRLKDGTPHDSFDAQIFSRAEAMLLENISSLDMVLQAGSTPQAIREALAACTSRDSPGGAQMQRLRTKLLASNKTAHTIRIGVMGGSITAGGKQPGFGPTDLVWPDVFGESLASAFGVRTEVFNAAVGGSTSEDSFYSIESRLPPDLDIVLWEHNYNDYYNEIVWANNRLDMPVEIDHPSRWYLCWLYKVSGLQGNEVHLIHTITELCLSLSTLESYLHLNPIYT
jgi:hypothetical protein